MYKPKLDKDIRCPLEYGLDIIGGKWDSRIICILSTMGTLRYSAIRNEMDDITDPVLAATLKKLIASGVVVRKQYDEMPLRVEYSLTAKGESLVPILHEICYWSGAFARDGVGDAVPQCQRCDYSAR